MGKHQDAVEATITAAAGAIDGRHTALLELVRTLAGQMDQAGADPSTRLSAAYLSTLKDLGRITATPARARGRSSLDELRQRRDAATVSSRIKAKHRT